MHHYKTKNGCDFIRFEFIICIIIIAKIKSNFKPTHQKLNCEKSSVHHIALEDYPVDRPTT